MSSEKPESPARAVIIAAEPQLFVGDINASCAFFTEKLGFSVAFVYGEPPFYAQVMRDAVRLNLRHVDRPLLDGALRERESLLSASMTLAGAAEVKALFLEFQAAGVDMHQPLRSEPWGARDFVIRDLDGNLLLFAGPME
jgi:catechol 2,3-dioxygenase-like lactoylglutathione lyase family enzyme